MLMSAELSYTANYFPVPPQAFAAATNEFLIIRPNFSLESKNSSRNKHDI